MARPQSLDKMTEREAACFRRLASEIRDKLGLTNAAIAEGLVGTGGPRTMPLRPVVPCEHLRRWSFRTVWFQ
jgi:hypothetical protein